MAEDLRPEAWGSTRKEHDPTDVEWVARLMCVAQGVNPDDLSEWPDFHFVWEHEIPQATRTLDHMQATGVKMTTNDPPQSGLQELGKAQDAAYAGNYGMSGLESGEKWTILHDAAPMTPRD